MKAWGSSDFNFITKYKIVQGQFEKRLFNLDFILEEKCSVYWLHIAL